MFYLFAFFLKISISVQSQSFNNQLTNSKSKAYALLDLGFSAKLLYLNTEGFNAILKKEEVKKSPRSLEEILSNSKNKSEELEIVINHNKYDLIVGCFSNINNAKSLVSKLIDQGHSSKIIGINNLGLHMVAIDSYVSESDARKDQKALYTDGISTWIKTN